MKKLANEHKKTRHYRMKRILSDFEKEGKNPTADERKMLPPSQYMVILHSEDGGKEWVDTLSKNRTKAKYIPYIKNEAKLKQWKKIDEKRIHTKRNKQGIEVWTSQKFDTIITRQLKSAFDKSVVNHMIQVRNDNIDTNSSKGSPAVI